MPNHRLPINTGDVYGRLTVTSAPIQRKGAGNIMYECECSCGGPNKYYYGHKLKSGHTRSCGCLRRDLISIRRMLAAKDKVVATNKEIDESKGSIEWRLK